MDPVLLMGSNQLFLPALDPRCFLRGERLNLEYLPTSLEFPLSDKSPVAEVKPFSALHCGIWNIIVSRDLLGWGF
jgi:hypothetical protein